jgi:tetratricopeptide (TPR) repeat protein
MAHQGGTESPQSTNSSSKDLKDKGNALFAKGENEQAYAVYTEALNELQNPTNPLGQDDVYLKAVCFSNRSNCLFEMAKYVDSIQDTKDCLGVIRDSPGDNEETVTARTSLRYTNLLRLARASFYACSTEPSVDNSLEHNLASCREALEELTSCSNPAYSRRALRMLKQLRYYESIPAASALSSSLRFNRAALSDPATEFYRFGHDEIMSALSAYEDSPPILLENLVDGNLAIFCGGINDARHVMATCMDIYKQWSLLEDKSVLRKVHLVMNDINTASVARCILFFVILHKIGSLVSTYAECRANVEASHLCMLMQYLYLSHAMPPVDQVARGHP